MVNQRQNEEDVYREIVERIEAELGVGVNNLTIEVVGEDVTVEGSVPSTRAREDLERLLFDTLELDEISFDVVVDEDLQSRQSAAGPLEEEIPGDGGSTGVAGRDLGNLSPSTRRQF